MSQAPERICKADIAPVRAPLDALRPTVPSDISSAKCSAIHAGGPRQ
jgi:hypothetical protein